MHDKLQQIFADSLGLKPSEVVDDLRYAETPQWDSVGHMALIAAIEDGFDIMIDAEHVVGMSSFGRAKEIVASYL